MKAFDWVDEHARRTPDATALACVETGETRTWAELESRVARLAHVLANGFGVQAGDRVTMLAENDTRTFELQFACMRIGAILAPLNWRLAQAELEVMAADADPSLIVFDGTWEAPAVALAETQGIKARLAWESHGPDASYEERLSEADGIPASTTTELDDATHVLYTSGTTGRPKGALSTHRTLHAHAINIAHANRMGEMGGHHLNVVPLFHAGGLNVYSNPTLYWGGRVTTVRRFDPALTLELLTDPGLAVTHFCGVLQMYEAITALPRFSAATFPSIRSALFGGWGPTTQGILDAWRSRGLSPQLSYGATELGPFVTVLPPDQHAAGDRGSSGYVLPYTEVRLVDGGGQDVGDDEDGEIWVRGPSVTPGYWRRDRDDYFVDDWFKSGDVAHRSPDGHFTIVGRMKEVYRSGGENIYPAEVEAALLGAPGVVEYCVVGVADPQWGEVGLVVVVAEEGAEVTLEPLRAYAGERIARFKLPKRIVVVDELPRNATGKVPRDQLRRQYGASTSGSAGD